MPQKFPTYTHIYIHHIMATLRTLYKQLEESANFNKTYTDAILRVRVAETSVSDGTLNSLKLTTTELYVNEEGKVSSFYIGVEGKINGTTLDIEVAFKTVETEIHHIYQKIPLNLLNDCKLDLGGDIFHTYVEKPYVTLYWALGNKVDLSDLEGL